MSRFYYQLSDPSDEAFINTSTGLISIITEPRTLSLIVYAEYLDEFTPEITSKTTELIIDLSPIELSSIKDVLYGELGELYYFKGIIEFAYTNHDYWMILNDGVNRIYVDCDDCEEYKGITFEIGDEVEIMGIRGTYWNNYYVPIIEDVRWLNVISSENTLTLTPTSMTVSDILAIDYTHPDVYSQYIEITGTILFSGNFSYPSYDLHEVGMIDDVYDIQLWDDDDAFYDERFELLIGQTVTIRGYLIGYGSIYSAFDWIILVTDALIVD